MATLQRDRIKVPAVAAVLCVVSIFLSAYTSRNRSVGSGANRAVLGALSPFQTLSAVLSSRAGGVVDRYVWLVAAKAENEALRSKVAELEASGSEAAELRAENRRLRDVLRVTARQGLRGVTAGVIGHDPSNWVESITVDRGAADGVRVGQAVIQARGVVGQVTAVSANAATVLLVTDRASQIDAVVQSGRARGSVEGRATEGAVLLYVSRPEDVRIGERLVTSGKDGVFPKGLIVGTIRGLRKKSGGMFSSFDVDPNVDLARLEEVFVVTSFSPPDAPAPGQGDEETVLAASVGGAAWGREY